MHPEIRRYRPVDASHLSRVFRASVEGLGPVHYSAAQVKVWASRTPSEIETHRRCIDGREVFIAVDDKDCPVAYIDLETNGHIDHLYCLPAYAGQGVASALYDALETIAKIHQISRLFTEASEGARRFFEHKSFAVIERCDFEIDGVPIYNFAMEKSLGNIE